MIMIVKEVTIESGGYGLSASLTTPSDDFTPIVITCHGLTRDKNGSKYKMLSEVLARKGMSTFRFDFYGHGASEGDMERFDNGVGVQNLESAVNCLSELGYDKKNVGMFGSSTGGNIIALYTAKDTEIGASVLRAPDFNRKTVLNCRNIRTPTMIITGDRDMLVSPQAAKRLYNYLNCEKDLRIIKGADHACREQAHINELMKLSVDWYEQHLL